MLYFTEAGVSSLEVPSEISLCIYISGCQNHCYHCQCPELQLPDYGEPLGKNGFILIAAYSPQITCVCFLGEGRNTQTEHEEFDGYVAYSHSLKLKACLYSGRDILPEGWMTEFDYIKVGSYQENQGPLTSPTTNQRLYKKQFGQYEDITPRFWNK